MTPLKLQYNCKFCGKVGEVKYQDEGLLTEEQVNFWLKYVACSRCATWERVRRDTIHWIYTACGNWAIFKYANEGKDGFDSAKNRTSQRFEKLLRRLSEGAQSFCNNSKLFQSSMVDEILESPNTANQVIDRILP
jgi:hypothetical protein